MTILDLYKDKTLMKIVVSAVLTVVIAFLLAYFIPYGWIGSLAVTIGIAYFYIRPLISKKLDEIGERLQKEFEQLEKESKLPKHEH